MITRDTIMNLIDRAGELSISLYLPTHRKGEEVQQDPIRLKNILRKVEEELEERGMDKRKQDGLLQKVRGLFDQPQFWQHNNKGLALFVTSGFFEYYRVPLRFDEQHLVDDHFLITPLLPMITLDGTFCVLALSQKNVRLLKATREKVAQIELEEAPSSMEEFQQYDVYEKHLSWTPSTGGGGASFHGWGDAAIESKAVEHYLNTIENEVTSILKKRNDPLIVMGVEEAVALYKKANKYHRLMDTAITTNPDPLNDKEVRDEGWKVIKTHFLRKMYEDMDRMSDLIGSDKQSENLAQIVEGAYYGKVDSLFIPIGEYSWGRFDRGKDTLHRSPGRKNGTHDLINLAAIKTLTQGGSVYALDKNEMPNNASIAAIFRY